MLNGIPALTCSPFFCCAGAPAEAVIRFPSQSCSFSIQPFFPSVRMNPDRSPTSPRAIKRACRICWGRSNPANQQPFRCPIRRRFYRSCPPIYHNSFPQKGRMCRRIYQKNADFCRTLLRRFITMHHYLAHGKRALIRPGGCAFFFAPAPLSVYAAEGIFAFRRLMRKGTKKECRAVLPA